MDTVIAIVAIVAVVIGVVAFAVHVRRRQANEHLTGPPTEPVEDRPAGPDAEAQGVMGPGEIGPRPEP
jgi:hypothetical protein